MAGLSMPEARFAKKISFAVGGRLQAAGRPSTAKAAGKKKSPGHSGQGTDNFA